MINISYDKQIVKKIIDFSYIKTSPLDPVIWNIIKIMIENSIDHKEAIKKAGLKDELYFIVESRFINAFLDHVPSYDDNNLQEMFKTNKMIRTHIDKIDIKIYDDFHVFKLNNIIYDLNDERKVFEKFLGNYESPKIINTTEEANSEIVSYKTKLNDMSYYEFGGLKGNNKKLIDSAKRVMLENNASIHFGIHTETLPENVELLTEFAYKRLKSSDYYNNGDDVNSFASVNISLNNIIVGRVYNFEGINFIRKDNLSLNNPFKTELSDELIKIFVEKKIGIKNKKLLIALGNGTLFKNLLEANEEIIDRDIITKLFELNFKLKDLKISIETFDYLYSRISRDEQAKLVKIVDKTVIKAISSIKIINSIISNHDKTMLTTKQISDSERFWHDKKIKMEEFQKIIGQIATSGIREGSKRLSNKDKKNIGFDSKIKKWIDRNLGHSKNIEEINDDLLKSARNILIVAENYKKYLNKV